MREVRDVTKRENVPGSPVVVCLRVRLLARVRSLALFC